MIWMPTGLLRAIALWPTALVSFVLWCGVLALVPALLVVPLLLAAAGGLFVLAGGRFETLATASLVGARVPMSGERDVLARVVEGLRRAGIGHHELLVRRRQRPTTPATTAMGRQTLVLTPGVIEAIERGWVSTKEAVALVAQEVAAHKALRPRVETATLVVMTPWRIVAGAFARVGAAFAWLPLSRTAWALRGVIGVICVLQSIADGLTAPGLLGVAVIALTYLMPAAGRELQTRSQNAGDIDVIARGLGPALAGFLRRYHYAVPLERLHHLEQPLPAPAQPPVAPWTTPAMPMTPFSLN